MKLSVVALAVSLIGCDTGEDSGDEVGDEAGDEGWSDAGGFETGGDFELPDLGAGEDDIGDEGGGGFGEDGPNEWAPPGHGPNSYCWDNHWEGDSLPAVILGNTIGLSHDFSGSCSAGLPSSDYQLGFTAPWDGTFAFDTAGSSFDTVLYIHRGVCGMPELECNDDFYGTESHVELELEAGEVVTVNVDGVDGFSEGPFKLTITEVIPPSCDTAFIIPNLPAFIQGDTSTAEDEFASGCGGIGAPEDLYRFVAPGPGTYRFDTSGSSFDTVIYTMEECGGPPYACNDDDNFDLQSELILELDGGEKVLLAVDGFGPGDSGPYLLNVEEL